MKEGGLKVGLHWGINSGGKGTYERNVSFLRGKNV